LRNVCIECDCFQQWVTMPWVTMPCIFVPSHIVRNGSVAIGSKCPGSQCPASFCLRISCEMDLLRSGRNALGHNALVAGGVLSVYIAGCASASAFGIRAAGGASARWPQRHTSRGHGECRRGVGVGVGNVEWETTARPQATNAASPREGGTSEVRSAPTTAWPANGSSRTPASGPRTHPPAAPAPTYGRD
jgi:hypothetical protein